MSYEYNIDFAPTKELLSSVSGQKNDVIEYENEYLNLLDMRKVAQKQMLRSFTNTVYYVVNILLKNAIEDYWLNILNT